MSVSRVLQRVVATPPRVPAAPAASSVSQSKETAVRDELVRGGGPTQLLAKAKAPSVAARSVTKQPTQDPTMAGNTPAVASLLARYGCDETLPRPAERVLTWAAKIEGALSGAEGTEAAIDHVMAMDLRRQVFLLEGILKLYAKKDSSFDKPFAAAKKLEDTLGDYSYARGMLKLAEEKKAPAAVVDVLRAAEKHARAQLGRVLEDGWLPAGKKGRSKQIRKLVRHLESHSWRSYDDDRTFLVKSLRKCVKDLIHDDFDMHVLDQGIHELRRHLRWLPVYSEATAGLVVLDESKNPAPAYTDMLSEPLAQSKYVTLPPPEREPAPVSLAKSLYVANMHYVLEFGAIKDHGEQLEGIGHAYEAAGLAKNEEEGRAMAQELLGMSAQDADITTAAQKLYDELRRNNLLGAWHDDLKLSLA